MQPLWARMWTLWAALQPLCSRMQPLWARMLPLCAGMEPLWARMQPLCLSPYMLECSPCKVECNTPVMQPL